jgi:exoribonuclease R
MTPQKNNTDANGSGRNYPPRSNNGTKKQTIFQSRRRDTQKPLLDNSKVIGMIPELFEGIFKVGKNGIGFVTHRDSKFVVMVETHHNAAHAINGDLVAIKVLSKTDGTGEVTKIVKRGKNAYAGIIIQKADWYYFQPTDPKEPEMRLILRCRVRTKISFQDVFELLMPIYIRAIGFSRDH